MMKCKLCKHFKKHSKKRGGGVETKKKTKHIPLTKCHALTLITNFTGAILVVEI